MKRYDFYGLGVDVFDKTELEHELLTAINKRERKILYGHALWSIPMMNKYPEIYKYGNKAGILVTDGRPFYILCKHIKKIPLKMEISIPNSVYLLLYLANKNNKSVFLLGADKITNQIAQDKINKKFPNINCNGLDGYFKKEQHIKIIDKINNIKPDVVLIGISSPIKEILAEDWRTKLDTGVIVPCGGMIDVLAGKAKLTPKFIKRLGLASFYRVFQEPKRLFKRYTYIYTFIFFRFFPAFIWNVFILKNKQFSIPKFCNISEND